MEIKKIDKLLLLIIFSLTTVLFLNSCCTKKYCEGADDLDNISFYDFNQQDLDTIIIKKFNKNSNYQNYLDSIFIVPEYFISSTEYEMIHLTDKIIIDFDYKIEIISTGQIFLLTGFITEKKKCNKGFMCFDYFNSLVSYNLNGEKQSYGFLRINNYK